MPAEGGPQRRSAAHPTVAGAARSCANAAGRWARLLLGGPGRRSRQRAARVALGAAVAQFLPDELAPSFLAEPLARRRAIVAELAGGGRHAPAPGGHARADRGRVLDAPDAAAERLLRVTARRRLRAVEAQLGAWATGLADLPVPELAPARRAADRAEQAVAGAQAELAASGRAALAGARLAMVLAGQAIADVAAWLAAGVARGADLAWAWLVSRRASLARGLTRGRERLAAGARRQPRAPTAATRGGRHALAKSGPAATVPEAWPAAGDDADAPPGQHERDWSGSPASVGPPGGARYWWTSPGPAADDDTRGWRPDWLDEDGVAGHDGASAGPHPDTVRLADPPDGAARNGAARGRHARDPVLAAVTGAAGAVAGAVRRVGGRLARWLKPVVVAVAAPPARARRPLLGLVRPVAAACVLSLVIGMFAALPTGVVMAGSVKAAGKGLPDLADLRPLDQPERTEVYDVNGKLIEVLKSDQDRIAVPLAAVPQTLQDAVVAAEDARFYEHRGVDQRGILRALFADLAEGDKAQGGSTITQQLVRNAYPHLKDRSLVRKVREAALAAALERRTSKPKILESYLNRVYFGGGYYGVEAASLGYFGRHVGQLSLAQAATLAGIIRAPESGNPRTSPREAIRLRDSVLGRMVELGMATAAVAGRARQERLAVLPRREYENARYRWFLDGVNQQLLADPRLGRTAEDRRKKLFEGGLRIFTTLNPTVQQQAEQAIRQRGPTLGSGHPDVALVAMVPSTGAVRAVVGGHDWRNGHYNLALQAARQAGSAFKPFVLASALENGISPDSVWDTQPPQQVCGTKWEFSNYEGEGGGQQSVRVATWLSINGVYGRLMDQLCPHKVTEMARRLGVRVEQGQQVPAMALGAANVHPVDMAAAYATFADMGVYHKPNFVTRVVRHGQLLFESTSPPGEQAVPPALAYEVNDVLKGVIDHGTAQAAQLGRPAAGKTGTTQNYKDAWFAGYTPQLATAVWMGYPETEQPMLNVDGVPRVFGGSFPARIWHDFMQQALAGVPPTDWQRPQEQLQYTVLPPPPTTTTQTTVPGQPGVPPTTVPGQTIPPPVPPSTVVQGAPLEPRRLPATPGLPARLSHQRE